MVSSHGHKMSQAAEPRPGSSTPHLLVPPLDDTTPRNVCAVIYTISDFKSYKRNSRKYLQL